MVQKYLKMLVYPVFALGLILQFQNCSEFNGFAPHKSLSNIGIEGDKESILHEGSDQQYPKNPCRPSSVVANTNIFYVDPINGSMANSGTKDSPWKTLEEVVDNRLIEKIDEQGKVSNPSAPVKPGDTLRLMSGYHGRLFLKNYYNTKAITIEAGDGEFPKLFGVKIYNTSHWKFKCLTISPSFDKSRTPASIFQALQSNKFIELSNSYLYTTLDTNIWVTREQWSDNAKGGVIMNDSAQYFLIKNNYVKNVSMGINIRHDSIAEGNVVENYTFDAVRIAGDDLTVQHNILINSLAVDTNHDDAIQIYGGHKNINIIGNIIISNLDNNNKFQGHLQGIGAFDGPLYRVLVEGNIIRIPRYHALALYDVQDSIISKNVITSSRADHATWIMLGTKKRGGNLNNTVTDNFAPEFRIGSDPEIIAKNNIEIMLSDANFIDKVVNQLITINKIYGDIHPIAKAKRLSKKQLNGIVK